MNSTGDKPMTIRGEMIYLASVGHCAVARWGGWGVIARTVPGKEIVEVVAFDCPQDIVQGCVDVLTGKAVR
jgi:hypothetical protein